MQITLISVSQGETLALFDGELLSFVCGVCNINIDNASHEKLLSLISALSAYYISEKPAHCITIMFCTEPYKLFCHPLKESDGDC